MTLKPESSHQVAFFEWLAYAFPKVLPVAFHVANQRRCSWAYGKLLKAMGVKAGVSDIFIMVPNKQFHALVIEMKSPEERKRKRKAKQDEFHASLNENGYLATYCFSVDEAIEITTHYLKNR
jgi:hypothetical protein